MAFFDRLKEKTGDMIEISKINGKINEEKRKIAVNKAALADYYWAKFERGEILDNEASALCSAIVASNEAIQDYSQEIQKIKEEQAQTAPPAATPPAVSAPPAAAPTSTISSAAPPPAAQAEPLVQTVEVSVETKAEASNPCQNCGALLPVSKKFCPECGTPNVSSEPPQEDIISCKNCGTVLEKGRKFCSECGTPTV